MIQLALAAVLFVGTHLLLPRSFLRGPLVGLLSEGGYKLLFSVAALGTLVWMIMAYNAAPQGRLWEDASLFWVPMVVMPFALILIVCGMSTPNPASMGQEKVASREEASYGILRVTRHPLNMGFALLALGHIPANGEVSTLWLFGAFLALGFLGALTQDRKKAAALGEDWARFAASTSVLPFAAILTGRNRLSLKEIGLVRPLLGLFIYLGLIPLHPFLFGVTVI